MNPSKPPEQSRYTTLRDYINFAYYLISAGLAYVAFTTKFGFVIFLCITVYAIMLAVRHACFMYLDSAEKKDKKD